jgi:hypothetical protein
MTGGDSGRGHARRRFAAVVAVATTAIALALLLIPAVDGAGPTVPTTAAGPPATNPAEGTCLLPPAQMRRTHMDLLYRERHDAVRLGRRDPDRSLQNCVDCHAVRDAAGMVVSADDPRHFCRTCHDQVAVATDCFSCHRSTPAGPVAARTQP